MAYPLDNALYQWEEGFRRLQELSEDPRTSRRLNHMIEAVRDELRRRIGATFTSNELAELYARGTDWTLEAARQVAPMEAADVDPQAISDAAFYLHLRGATDYAGGRLIPAE